MTGVLQRAWHDRPRRQIDSAHRLADRILDAARSPPYTIESGIRGLRVPKRTGRRACHEDLYLQIRLDGTVGVVNRSYGDAADLHTYTVPIENGLPAGCSCPDWQYRKRVCKHMVRVALAEPVCEITGVLARE